MAKQTFTTGQVLTAAEMTTLQTNDYNQTVTAKVASYTLVAADAGTRITMSNAGATAITVNTSLFTAGDTLFITNIGAGVCTITAGTATVSTISSLVLSQYDSGCLYFTSTGVAIWEKYQGAAASSGGMTVISTGTLSSTGVTFSAIAGTYINLELQITGYNVGGNRLYIRLNGDSGTNYTGAWIRGRNGTADTGADNASPGQAAQIDVDGGVTPDSGATNSAIISFPAYATATGVKVVESLNYALSTYKIPSIQFASYNGTAGAITSITIVSSGGTFSAGTYTLYGVK